MFASHLDKNFGTAEMKKIANRDGFGEGLLEAGKRDENVVALCADLTESTRVQTFAESFPKRFIQVGIAEQNMASVAAGMAAMGKIPFIASYAMFCPGRNWEQIRTTVAYNNSNVKIIGAHAGVSVGPDGATHQAIEDIAIMRVVPNMVVVAPADVHEARKATLAAAKYEGSVYIRLARSNTPVVTSLESPFEFGKAYRLFETTLEKKVGLVVTGVLLASALLAAKELEAEGIGVTVLHLPTIKPLDYEALDLLAKENNLIVTAEEHQRIGGLGSAVSEYLSETNPRKIIRIGIDDEFGQSGEPDELWAHYGLDQKAIKNTIKREL